MVHSFRVFPDGAAPLGRLLQTADGRIYGTSSGGECARGIVFVLDPNGSGGFSFRVLHSFCGSDGSIPYGGLVVGPEGYFYGITVLEGSFNLGTAYRIDASGRLTVLHQFQGPPDAGNPNFGELLAASDGYLYGARRRAATPTPG